MRRRYAWLTCAVVASLIAAAHARVLSGAGPRRALLQPSIPITPECSRAFGTAFAGCSDITARTPGSACCAGMQLVDPACMEAVNSNLVDPAVISNLNSILQSCQSSTSPAPSPSPNPAPSPDSNSDLTPAPGPSQPLDVLPEGEVVAHWSAGRTATCYTYDPVTKNFVNETGAPEWTGSGSDWPTDAESEPYIQAICQNSTEDAGALVIEAVKEGGPAAQAALAALLGTKTAEQCPDAAQNTFRELINAPESGNHTTAMSYFDNFRDACDVVGAGCCISLVVRDTWTDEVLYNATVHTSGTSDSGDSCMDGFSSALASSCAGQDTSPGSACCTAVEAVGEACLDELAAAAANNSNPLFTVAYTQVANGCGLGQPALPNGTAQVYFSLGDTSWCYNYSSITGAWVNDTTATGGPWSGSGSEMPDAALVTEVVGRVCADGEAAGPYLAGIFSEGGERAKAACRALFWQQTCPAGGGDADPQQRAAAMAFVNQPELNTTTTVMGIVQNFVEALDSVGGGACVTVVVLDDSRKVVFTERVHTKEGPATAAAAAPATTSRAARSLGERRERPHLRGSASDEMRGAAPGGRYASQLGRVGVAVRDQREAIGF